MTIRNDGGRLPAKSAATVTITETTSKPDGGPSCGDTITRGLARRRDAARRLAALICGHRDPDLCQVATAGRSSFGLTRRELISEIRRCHRSGWQRWELDARFTAAGDHGGEAAL